MSVYDIINLVFYMIPIYVLLIYVMYRLKKLED